MLKKIVLFALLLIPVMGFGQEKIAYFKSSDVIPAMPEYTQMLDSLKKSEAALQAELETMADEYTKKVTAFSEQQATLNESIKALRLKEIERIRESTETFQRQAAQIQDDLQKTLFTPIEAKIRKALQEVGAENQFTYIVNADIMLYISPQSQDATPLVKTKLGIK
ncbi:MAG: OmpH family outer membrane protein [Dysgonamonadaceae bacterium]|jgi:outer membrane protein|nr:OmpH family outer membrane protein [Dysgonamonadaceae bacterium]